ncbi:MAG TPA: FIST N-terminal domain-containing protein, partial [Nitrospirota bacterium]|nr:FIST N-terminal domain-containing protein [Nitrospirota bacterium]
MFLERPSIETLVQAAAGLKRSDDDVICILLGEKSSALVPRMINGLNQRRIVFFGGTFPGVVTAQGRSDDGAVLLALPSLAPPLLFQDLSSVDEHGSELMAIRNSLEKQYTALVLVDGLTSNISLFLRELFHALGNSVTYLGGGAGSLSLVQRPC